LKQRKYHTEKKEKVKNKKQKVAGQAYSLKA
jgi:hypothetical protein